MPIAWSLSIASRSTDKELAAVCRCYRVRELALFGSVLREEFREDSDIDVLIEFEAGARIRLFELGGLKEELSVLLGREVDLVGKAGLKQVIRERVLSSRQVIYTRESGVQMPSLLGAERSKAIAPQDRDLLHLSNIAESCAAIEEFVASPSTDAPRSEDLRRDAILFELSRLGEAIKHVSPALRQRHSDAPWQVVHDTGVDVINNYHDIDWELVRSVATTAVPLLRQKVAAILTTEYPDRATR